ncbi:hypothetical protein RYZ20_00745 [Thioclava sp. A2]|uniref:hypothetical protein n=1 Tax=Thioclava sp. FCG-A2 TaxID=3080562 RepID=UPI002953E873|nr:hypothetical protein [Thioclava sp. A2]MDV7269423.1 hypothetical protein [Thioclava sp. A2]
MAGHNCHSTTGGGDRFAGKMPFAAVPVQAMEKDLSADHEASICSARPPSGVDLSLEKLDLMLPYDGLRNTVRRSQSAKTGMFVGRTEEDQGRPRPIGFESGLERAVAISCLLHPQTVGLKCQPLTVHFDPPVSGTRSHTLDYLLSQRCGAQTFIFVKNEEALARPKMEALTRAIRVALPDGFRFAVISEASFPVPNSD